MTLKLAIAIVLSLATYYNAYAHDSNRIEQLEKELEETKQRLSNLESMIEGEDGTKEFKFTGDGWKSISNWRMLTTGMKPDTVKNILGDAHRVDGGRLAIWYYSNRGRVWFYDGEVDRWEEPREF